MACLGGVNREEAFMLSGWYENKIKLKDTKA